MEGCRGSASSRTNLWVYFTEVACCGDGRTDGEVFLGVWGAADDINFIKVLGINFLFSNNDWPEVDQNMRRSQGKWGRLVKVLGREGADRRTAGRFYVAVVQAVLLFGSEKWVATPWLEKSLARFHHWVVWRMAGMVPECQLNGTWI